jgi:uncharacterized membrane protein YfcA
MEYALLALWCFLIALAGGLVGLVLGNLRLPVVLLLASSPAAGAGANVGVSAVAAASASIAHIRAGRVNWRLFAWMAPPTVVGALLGGYLSGVIPGDLLLFFIATVLIYSAIDLLRWQRSPASRDAIRRREGLDLTAAVLVGLGIGLLGGIVGLILGTLRVPALLRLVGETPAMAVGTNVTIGFCLGVAGVIGHLPSEAPDWDLLAVGAAASVPGALLGSRLTGRLSEERLLQAIAVILLIAALGLLVQAVT